MGQDALLGTRVCIFHSSARGMYTLTVYHILYTSFFVSAYCTELDWNSINFILELPNVGW